MDVDTTGQASELLIAQLLEEDLRLVEEARQFRRASLITGSKPERLRCLERADTQGDPSCFRSRRYGNCIDDVGSRRPSRQ